MKLRIDEYLKSPIGVWYRVCVEFARFINRNTKQAQLVHDHKRIAWKEVQNEYLKYQKTRTASSVVYTCITKGYDDIDEIAIPGYINPEWDYVCFTDCESDLEKGRVGVWEIRPLAYADSDATRNNRWHKMHPVELFPEYKQSIYIDANIDILTPWIFDEIKRRNQNFILPRHPQRKCIYQEYKQVLSQFIDEPRRILEERRLIKKSGMPRNYGLGENNILYRRHDSDLIRAIMNEWWDMEVRYSKRDQLSLMWILWKNGIDVQDIMISNPRFDTDNFCVFAHKKASAQSDNRCANV